MANASEIINCYSCYKPIDAAERLELAATERKGNIVWVCAECIAAGYTIDATKIRAEHDLIKRLNTSPRYLCCGAPAQADEVALDYCGWWRCKRPSPNPLPATPGILGDAAAKLIADAIRDIRASLPELTSATVRLPE